MYNLCLKIILCFLIIIFILYILIRYRSSFLFIKNDSLLPDYNSCDGFLSIEEQTTLLKNINNCEFIKENPLNEGFQNSRGFVIKFTDGELLEKHFIENNLIFVYEMFKKIKDPACNAFIFNILIIPSKNIKEDSVAMHHDCTFEARETNFPYRYYLPKCVNVIYAKICNEFKGGKLKLYDFNGNHVKHYITPKERKMVMFRGDQLHCVQNYISKDKSPRISLVFEQYQLPLNTLPNYTFEII